MLSCLKERIGKVTGCKGKLFRQAWEGDLLYIYEHIISVDGKQQFLKINAYQAKTG